MVGLYRVIAAGEALLAPTVTRRLRAVHDQIVLGLERSGRHRRVREQQSVQVQDQACVQRAPVLLEQAVMFWTRAGRRAQ